MINPKDIEISRIRDLKLIFFYNINRSEDNSYIGLKIIFGDSETLEFEYTDEEWRDFVSKVIMTYNKEKDTHNIMLLDDFTKEIINSIDLNSFREEITENHSQADPISVTSSRNFQIQMIKDYLKDVAFSVISLFHSEESISDIDIKGYRDRYVVTYKINGEEHFFPMIITRTTEDNFDFKIGFVEGNELLINGEVDLGNNYVNVKWSDSSKKLYGKSIYNLDGNVNEKVVKSSDEVIYYSETDSRIDSSIRNLINFYLNLAGIEINGKEAKTVGDNYILSSNNVSSEGDNELHNGKSCHIKFDDKYVHIIYNETTGLSKCNNELVIPFYKEAQEILFIPFMCNKKSYVLMQRAWLPRDVMQGDYKEKIINRYFYSVFEVSPECNLLNGFETLDSFKITGVVNNMDDINEFIMKKRGR